jgi:hypothetical protein
MPYSIRKRKCRQSSGKKGDYTLSYTDKKGKKHSNCHTSRKKAQGQIAAIEGPRESIVRLTVREMLREICETTYATRTTFFANPYEDPGPEFEIDEDDPIGLLRLDRDSKADDEVKGRNSGRN